MLPFANLRKLAVVTDVLEETSRQVIESKKQALAKGDEAVLAQVGEGKDIMSILCELPTSLPFLPSIQCLSFSTCKSGGIGRGPSS